MFENATLQEAYTGSLIAGKGRALNNIRSIMDRTKFRHEDWARVRFGAGTPWRRCWCVITPPDDKEVQRQQKNAKKKSAYDRSPPSIKGDIRFYDTKKTKKAMPIATIRDAFSAYAIYPQSKPLIDQSTLVKVEGIVTIHSMPETTTEGFVFVMPEVHPAVTGFEMMLRWLFPLYDVFALYGRPTRLIADTLDVRSLMFALPQEKRYGYLDILDVAALIHENGSQTWSEKDWRRKLKEATSARISKLQSGGDRPRSRASTYRGHRNSLPSSRTNTLRFEDGASIRSTPSLREEAGPPPPPHKPGSAPPAQNPFGMPNGKTRHQRSVSEAVGNSTPRQRSQRSIHDNQQSYTPSRLSYEAPPAPLSYEQPAPEPMPYAQAPPPPNHGIPVGRDGRLAPMKYPNEIEGSSGRSSSESEKQYRGVAEVDPQEIRQNLRPASPPTPVATPPAFIHEPGAKPPKRPLQSPEMRRANSRMSITTLSQLADAGQPTPGGGVAAAGAAAAWNRNGQQNGGRRSEDQGSRGVIGDANANRIEADRSPATEGMVLANNASQTDPYYGHSPNGSKIRNQQAQLSYQHQVQSSPLGLRPPFESATRSVSPLSQSSIPGSPSGPLLESTYFPQPTSRASSSTSVRNKRETAVEHPPLPTERPENPRTTSGHSIRRKPLPSRTPPLPSELPAGDERTFSLDSLQQHVVDEDALDQLITRERSRSITETKDYSSPRRQSSAHDSDSIASPDYASTRPSTETKRSVKSVERPRVGKLKTVGIVEPVPAEAVVGDIRYRPDEVKPQVDTDIPTVDFGPTYVYNPTSSSRPPTSEALNQPIPERNKSSDKLTPSPRNEEFADSFRGVSPIDGTHGRHKSGDGLTPSPSGGSEDLIHAGREPYERSPSRNLATPEPGVRTPSAGSDYEHRRSIAWQPGTTIGGGSPGGRQSLTPEQFVQQRAVAARVTPVYAHGRKQSTPPLGSRTPSGEIVQQHNRQSSFAKELPSRPHSRQSTVMLNSTDYSNHLSAREQEHVARVTGSPLINMAKNPKRQPPQGSGLVGAIEAREQEKKDIKDGLSGQMVQHAIAQRQQHAQGHQARQQTFQAPAPASQMQMPGSFPPSPGQYYTAPHYSGWGVSPQQQQQYHPQPQYSQQAYALAAHSGPYSPQPSQMAYQQPNIQGFSPQQSQTTYQQPNQFGQYQQQAASQQGQYDPNQPQYYGPYFGNGHGGR